MTTQHDGYGDIIKKFIRHLLGRNGWRKTLGNNRTLTKTSKTLDMCHRSYFSFAARQAVGKNQRTHSMIHEHKLAGYASRKNIHSHFTTKTQVARVFKSSLTLFSGCEDSVTSPATFDHFKIFSSHRTTTLHHKSNEITLFFN